jgi:hypothetical protein
MKEHQVKKMKNLVFNALIEWERHKKKNKIEGDINLGIIMDFANSFVQVEIK